MVLSLKKDEEGNPVFQDEMPVYVYEDGKEVPVDVPGLMAKIPELNEESKNHRLRAQEAEKAIEALKAVAGEEDPQEWLKQAAKATKTLEALEGKHKGELDALKASMTEGWEKKLADKDKALKAKDGQIYKLMVSSQFAKSPYILEKTVLPPDMAEAYFGKHFKIEEKDGDLRVIGYTGDNPVFSRERPGEVADFEEAVAAIIGEYPMKDRILKESPGGSGSKGNKGEQPPPPGPFNPMKASAREKSDFIAKHGLPAFQEAMDRAIAAPAPAA